MITLNVWLPQRGNVGHASAFIDQAGNNDGYVSWWPQGDWKKNRPGAANPGFGDDVAAEARQPDRVRLIGNLNEQAGLNWWTSFRGDRRSVYQAWTQNCSWAVITMLKAAGGDSKISWTGFTTKYNMSWQALSGTATVASLARGLAGDMTDKMDYIDNHTLIWTPADCLRYADAVVAGGM